MNTKTLTAIATAAGIDLDARGGRSAFARALGVHAAQLSTALNSGSVGNRVAEAANDLAEQIKDGTYTPATDAKPTVDVEALPANPEDELTDDQLLANINKRFRCMDRFVEFAIDGKFRCVLVTGPGGIGKTYPIEQMLRDADDGRRSIVCVSGAISAVGLVEALWNTQNKGDVLLIDDADGGLANVDFLNVFKSAADTKGRRVVSWMKQNKTLKEAGVEPQFEYEGTIIVISNADMKAVASGTSARAGHMDAVLSRAQHIDLGINSSRALALRVADMILNKGMLDQKFAMADMSDLAEQGAQEIAAFIKTNRDNFRSLTLREAAKIADIYIACEGEPEWADMAQLSCGQL